MRLGIGLGALALVIAACSDSGAPGSASSPSSSPDEARTGTQQQAIQGGVDDPTDRYAVGLCRSGFAGRCTAKCSGALILPNLVATARHCVSQSPQQIDCSTENPEFGPLHGGTLVITTNGNMATAGTVDATNTGWYSVKSIALPTDAHLCGNDIALVTLNKPVPATEAKPITPGVEYFMWDPIPNYSLSFAAIGFGLTSPNPQPDTAGIRRKRMPISVICIPNSDRRECPEDAKIPKGEFIGGDGICSGDSGSSAYEQTSYTTGTPISFGVLSRGGESGSSCKGSVYTRFDQHRQWVVDVAQQASNNWTLYPKPTWTNLKPEPVRQQTGEEADGGTGKPKVGLGEACSGSSQCESKMCIDTGAGGVCSKICDSKKQDACPEGFACVDSQCIKGATEDAPPPAAAPATTTTVTKDGCATAMAPLTASFGSSAWLLAGLAGLLASRRRKNT